MPTYQEIKNRLVLHLVPCHTNATPIYQLMQGYQLVIDYADGGGFLVDTFQEYDGIVAMFNCHDESIESMEVRFNEVFKGRLIKLAEWDNVAKEFKGEYITLL